MSVAITRCPICKKSIDEADRTASFPFCTERCKLIDLGRWLSDAYQIPADDGGGQSAEEESPDRSWGAPPQP